MKNFTLGGAQDLQFSSHDGEVSPPLKKGLIARMGGVGRPNPHHRVMLLQKLEIPQPAPNDAHCQLDMRSGIDPSKRRRLASATARPRVCDQVARCSSWRRLVHVPTKRRRLAGRPAGHDSMSIRHRQCNPRRDTAYLIT
jgi:hypothetical protein